MFSVDQETTVKERVCRYCGSDELAMHHAACPIALKHKALEHEARFYDVIPGTNIPVPENPTDSVNHPPHYTSHPSGIECIQITEHMGFNLGNAFKYIWRADLKGSSIEDLEKAVWYIRREIDRRKRGSAIPDSEPPF